MTLDTIRIWTDGSCYCEKHGGPGGWAALIRSNYWQTILTGGNVRTTPVRMELIAVAEALEWTAEYVSTPCPILVCTDLRTIVLAGVKTFAKWNSSDWRSKSSHREIKNRDLWERIYRQTLTQDVRWQWVSRAGGCNQNRRVDRLARNAAEPYLMQWNEEVLGNGETRAQAAPCRS